MSTVTIIDLETTGLHPSADEVVEIGAILYDLDTNSVINQSSCLCYCEENKQYHTNKISPSITHHSNNFKHQYDCVMELINYSTILIAHNKFFEMKWFNGNNLPILKNKIWLCTQKDFEFPVELKDKKLITLAKAHNIPLYNLHRALNDCRLISDIFDQYESNVLKEMIKWAYKKNKRRKINEKSND